MADDFLSFFAGCNWQTPSVFSSFDVLCVSWAFLLLLISSGKNGVCKLLALSFFFKHYLNARVKLCSFPSDMSLAFLFGIYIITGLSLYNVCGGDFLHVFMSKYIFSYLQ